MKFDINGTIYEYDMEHVSVRDAMMLKGATGFNLRPFSQALGDLDPDCMAALAWVIQTKAGVKGADGDPLKLADVDFDMTAFLAEELEEDEADPTTGGLSSGNGATPDSTSPEPASTTA